MNRPRAGARRAGPLALLALLVTGCRDGESAQTPTATTPTARTNAISTVGTAPEPAPEPLPDLVRVRLDTGAGPILLELDAKRAPITAANFVRYTETGRFDGASFYRAAPTKGANGKPIPGRGFIQGGIRRNARKTLTPIAHEPTSQTGLKHGPGTISMARNAETGVGAMGEFFITLNAMPEMDARGDEGGFAVFGRVVEGMDTVRRILEAPTVPNAGRGAMRGQMIAEPVRIVRTRRVA